jgi:tyrosine-protein kinase Etk/Wzc
VPYGQVIQTDKVAFSIQKNTHTPGYNGQKVRYIKMSYDAAASQLNGSISVGPSGKESEILAVTTSSRSSSRNTDVLNELLRVFNQDGIDDRQEISKRTISFVNERFVSLTRELDSIEFDKEGYKRTNQISYIEADATMAGSRRERATTQLDQTETQMLLSRILLDALRVSGAEELLPGDLGLANMQINALIADYNKMILDLKQLKASTGDNHPTVVRLRETLASLRQNISASIRSYETQVKMSVQQLKRIQTESLGIYGTIPEKEKTLRAIERQQQIKESLYMILLQKREEAAINLAITEPSVKVVDYAIAQNAPIAPNRKMIWFGAIAIGLLLPFGSLYLFFLTDTKLHTRKDIQLACPEIPIVAEIPHNDSGIKLVLLSDRSVMAEAFRILRTNMLYLLPRVTPGLAQVIYVTSTIKSEGKTFTTTNLSVSLASLNKKVLLIGADVRNPQIHKLLGFEKNQIGVSNYLSAKVSDWHTLIKRDSSVNKALDVIFSGPIPPNPAELLSNGRFEQFLNEAKLEYDYIIVDTAPVLLVTDTLLISSLADLTLYVCRSNFTEKKLLEFSKELSADNKLINMAYVINDVGAGKAYGYGYGYGSKYTYNYGYGYGYSADKQIKSSLFKTISRKIKRK